MAEANAIVTSISPKPATPESRWLRVYDDGDAMRTSEDFWCEDDALDFLADTDREGYAYSVEMMPDGPVKHGLEDAADAYRAEQHAEFRQQMALTHFYHGAR